MDLGELNRQVSAWKPPTGLHMFEVEGVAAFLVHNGAGESRCMGEVDLDGGPFPGPAEQAYSYLMVTADVTNRPHGVRCYGVAFVLDEITTVMEIQERLHRAAQLLLEAVR